MYGWHTEMLIIIKGNRKKWQVFVIQIVEQKKKVRYGMILNESINNLHFI